MKIKIKAKPAPIVEKRAISSPPIRLSLDNDELPSILGNVLYAWYKIGNPLVNSLEAELKCSAKGLKFDTPVDNLYGIRTLVYLGYMARTEYTKPGYVVRCDLYKLTPKGKEAGRRIALSIGDLEPDTENTDVIVECVKCHGEGLVGDDICSVCMGEGTIVKKTRSTVPAKPVQTSLRQGVSISPREAKPQPVGRPRVMVKRK